MCRLATILGLGLVILSSSASAQTVSERIALVLAEQQPAPGPAPDAAAISTTLQSISGLVAVELAMLPADSSSGGFVYRLDPTLGVIARSGNGFGPFITESVLRGGRGQTNIGVRYKSSRFESLQDGDLDDGTFPTNATRLAGTTAPLTVDLLRLDIEAQTMTLTGSYGVDDRLSLGGSLPFVRLTVRGERTRAQNDLRTLQSRQAGSATGLGDVNLNVRYRLVDRGPTGMTLGGDLRLPTGSADDLLGAGSAAARMLGLGSWERGAVAVHVNGGVGVGGVSREAFWAGAATYAVTPHVTVVGEVIGRYLTQLAAIAPIYQPSLDAAGIESMRWTPVDRGLYTSFFVGGAKWNIGRNILLNGNVLFRADGNGLQARVTPTLSVEFDFQR